MLRRELIQTMIVAPFSFYRRFASTPLPKKDISLRQNIAYEDVDGKFPSNCTLSFSFKDDRMDHIEENWECLGADRNAMFYTKEEFDRARSIRDKSMHNPIFFISKYKFKLKCITVGYNIKEHLSKESIDFIRNSL